MCKEDMNIDNYVLPGEVVSKRGPVPWEEDSPVVLWDVIVSFSVLDEEILDPALDLETAKLLILDYYADLYKKEDCTLLIRRRQRDYPVKGHLKLVKGD